MAAVRRPIFVSEDATAAAAAAAAAADASSSRYRQQDDRHQARFGDVDVCRSLANFGCDDDVGRRRRTELDEGRMLYADPRPPRRCSSVNDHAEDTKSNEETEATEGLHLHLHSSSSSSSSSIVTSKDS